MMIIRRPEKENWCCVCDNATAEVEISNNGSFKLFWAASEHDNEICFCRNCFETLKSLVNNFDFDD